MKRAVGVVDQRGVSKRIVAAAALVAAAVLGPVRAITADEPAGVPSGELAVPALEAAPGTDPEPAGGELGSWQASTPLAAGASPSEETAVLGETLSADDALTAVGAASGSNKFVPVTPTRVLDTRDGTGGWWGKVPVNGDLPVAIAGTAGVPGNASAVVLNLTVTEAEQLGFVTVFPADQGLPNASSINVEYSGQTVANLVTVPLGSGGVRIYTQLRTHLLADVAGYYVPAASSTSGRFQAVAPLRLLDTREPGQHPGRFAAGEQLDLDVAGLVGLPRTATAAVLNLTATEPTAAGFLSVTPQGAPIGGVSNLNVAGAGQTIANQVVVPLNNGVATVYSAVGSHVIVDLAGWYSGSEGATSSDGLFVPVTPGRLLDTRDPANSPIAPRKPGANATVDVTAASRRGIPAGGVSALVVNATATEATGAGFFTLFGAGLGRPLASNLNVNFPGQTVPNHAVVPVSTAGFSFFTSSGASLIVDVSGYFTGAAPSPSVGYVPNTSAGPPSTGPHSFLYQMNDGSFARWNPCSAITYQVNYSGAPAFARSEVAKAIAKVEAATGLDFVDLGETTLGNDGSPPAGVKAVISFVNSAENPNINNVAGLGGGSYYTPQNGRDAYVADGFVLINESTTYQQGTGPIGLEGLLLHEIGHMVGLNHVQDIREVMYPVMHTLPDGGFGPGDLEGLWHLGAAQRCLNTGASGFGTQSLGETEGDPIRVQQFQDGDTDSGTGTDGDRGRLVVAYCDLSANPALTADLLANRGDGTRVAAVTSMATPGSA